MCSPRSAPSAISGASAPEGLQLDATHSYALLVGVAERGKPSVWRVKAADPDSSYIIRKLQGSPGIIGQRMPFGGPYLPQSTIDVIRQWIANGAPQPAAARMSLEAAVKAYNTSRSRRPRPITAPLSAWRLPRIVVSFNGDLDSNLFNNTTVTLVNGGRASPIDDRETATGNPAAFVITRSPL